MKDAAKDDLRALKRRLVEAARAEAEAQARAQERATAAQRERELFARSVGAVTPLKAAPRADRRKPRPTPEPRQRRLDDAAVLESSLSDGFDLESLLDTDAGLSWQRAGIGPEVVRKLRRGVWATQAELDLHGLQRDAARERLAAFVHDAARRGLRCVRVVHGKGHGSPGRRPVLKGKAIAWLAQSADVLAFVQARASDGGAGALMVLLEA